MIEKSTLSHALSESRRWCECGSSEINEWTHEGGRNAAKLLVMADGDFTRNQGSAYVGMRKVLNASIYAFVPVLSDKSVFIF